MSDNRRERKIILALPHLDTVRFVRKSRACEFDTDTLLIMPTIEDCLVAFFDAEMAKGYCSICLTPFDEKEHQNCGGDCLSCMADAHDPDCMQAMEELRRN